MKIIVSFFVCLISISSFSQISEYDNLDNKPMYYNTYNEYETCFCFEFYIDPLAWLDAFNALQQAQYEAFYQAQRNAVKYEIEQRLNKNFSDYEQAVKEIFKEKATGDFSSQYLSEKIDYLIPKIQKAIPIAQLERDKYRLFQQLQYNTGNSTMFGQLKYNNKLLTNMTSSEAFNLWNNVYGANDQALQSEIIQDIRQKEALNRIKFNGELSTYLSTKMWVHHRSYNNYNQIRQITSYMIYFANLESRYSLVNEVRGLLPDLNYFQTPDLQYWSDYNINSLINDNIDFSDTYNSTNKSLNDLKLAYSTEKENIGLATYNFLSDHPDIKEASAVYMSRHNYSNRSIDNIKEILENFRYDDPLISSSYLAGTHVSTQTLDRPDRVFYMRWSSSAISKGYQDISLVLKQLSLIENNYDDGPLIKSVLSRNFGGTLPSTIDYGKLFDFDYSSSGLIIRFSPFAVNHTFGDFEHSDNIYGWSLFTNPIKVQMLETISNDGCVNFNNQIVSESCLKTWYLDRDGDGYHSDTTEAKSKPSANWTDNTKGQDCDDYNAKYKFENLNLAESVIYTHNNNKPDMLSGDLTFNDIYQLIDQNSNLSTTEKIHAKFSFKLDELYDPYTTNSEYLSRLREFAELTTLNDELVNAMIDRFSENDENSIFTNSNLSNTIINDANFLDYLNVINEELKIAVSEIENENDNLSNIDPGVVSFSSNGTLFAWHGTSEHTVTIKSLTINCRTFSYSATIELVDHFGLDNGDLFNSNFVALGARSVAGMRAWYILQRIRGLKPYKSKVSKSVSKTNVSF